MMDRLKDAATLLSVLVVLALPTTLLLAALFR